MTRAKLELGWPVCLCRHACNASQTMFPFRRTNTNTLVRDTVPTVPYISYYDATHLTPQKD